MSVDLTPTTVPPATAGPQLAVVRAELELQRRFRVEQIEEVEVDAAEALAAGDDARLQVSRVLHLTAEAALEEIDAALDRLADGTYGTCERCHQPIPLERLEVLPTSRSCTPCQARTESRRARRTSAATHSGWPVAGPASPSTRASMPEGHAV